jgi:hypothetical protein
MKRLIQGWSIAVMMFVAAGLSAQNLIFWNKLGSTTEIQNSEVGVDGVVTGSLVFDPVKFGNGVRTTSGANTVGFPNLFGAGGYSSFAVEFWTYWRDAGNSDYPLFMVQQNPTSIGTNAFMITVADDVSARDLAVQCWDGAKGFAYNWHVPSDTYGYSQHIAVSVDMDAPYGQKVKLYLDGVSIGAPYNFQENAVPAAFVFPPNVFLNDNAATGWVELVSPMDNLKVYDYAKTNFSDRNYEDGVVPAPVTVSSNLIFWNKLGSTTEIQNSEVGVDGTIVGTCGYSPVQFNNGVGAFSSTSSFVKFDSLFGTNAYSALTIEYWFKWVNTGTSDYFPFFVRDDPAVTAPYSFYIGVNGMTATTAIVSIQLQLPSGAYVLTSWYVNFTAGQIDHIAWNIDFTRPVNQKIKLYVNGVDQGAPSDLNSESGGITSYRMPRYALVNSGSVGSGIAMPSYMDNLKIWDYAKTDFSDRNTENAGFITTVESNLIFWNRLGCGTEISNSETGPDGVVTGTPVYQPVKFGNGLASCSSTNFVTFPDALTSPGIGTVEFWWKAGFDSATVPSTAHRDILIAKTPGVTHQLAVIFNVVDRQFQVLFWSSSYDYYCNYIFNSSSFSEGEVLHFAFSFNKDAANYEKLKLYINGTRVPFKRWASYSSPTASNSDTGWTGFPALDIVVDANNWGAQAGAVDNIKVYDYEKSVFSDRNVYDGIDLCVGSPSVTNTNITGSGLTAPAEVKITAGSGRVNLNWDVVASALGYNVYKSTVSGFTPSIANRAAQISGHTWQDNDVENSTRYFYVVTSYDADDESEPSGEVWATPGTAQHNLLLKRNKFSPSKGESVEMSFVIPSSAKVKLRVVDANSKTVYESADLYLPAGTFEQEWDGKSAGGTAQPPGVYAVQFLVDDKLVETQMMILQK